jgi:hypothetical protein
MTVLADLPPELRVLREELAELRRIHPRRSSVVAEAFQRLVRAGDAVGQPVDGLRTHTRDEVERFFAQTIPGPDGHVYWDGSRHGFKRNDGRNRSPRRWWYTHKHGTELGTYEDFVPTCGERHCINPDHCAVGRGLRRMRFDRQAMLGALQVVALRLGRAPTSSEWERLGGRPSVSLYQMRFGTWPDAVREAGLVPAVGSSRFAPTTPVRCIASLRFVRESVGHWPTRAEFEAARPQLHAIELPSSSSTIKKYLGPWTAALRKAGKR